MLHYYDQPPETVEYQIIRLGPTRPVIEAGIPCVVWAEDALSFAHFIPYNLLTLEILVPDELVDRACEAICRALPYTRMAAPPGDWINYKYHDPNEGLWTTKSIPLERTSDSTCLDDPPQIHIHPQSLYSFHVRDEKMSLAFPERYPTPLHLVRFPTLAAFTDAAIAALLDPPCGFFHMKMSRVMRCYVAYIITYTFRGVLRSEDRTLLPRPRLLLESLREENKPFFEACLSDRRERPDWLIEAKKRKEMLTKLGRPTRPLPTDFRRPNFPHLRKQEFHTFSQQTNGPQVNAGSSHSRSALNASGSLRSSDELARLLRPHLSPIMGHGLLLSAAKKLVRRVV